MFDITQLQGSIGFIGGAEASVNYFSTDDDRYLYGHSSFSTFEIAGKTGTFGWGGSFNMGNGAFYIDPYARPSDIYEKAITGFNFSANAPQLFGVSGGIGIQTGKSDYYGGKTLYNYSTFGVGYGAKWKQDYGSDNMIRLVTQDYVSFQSLNATWFIHRESPPSRFDSLRTALL